MRKKTRYIFLFIIFTSFIAGCAARRNAPLEEAGLTVPEAWAWAAVSAPVEPWLADFKSSALKAIVIEALKGNYDLQATVARMDAARASARSVGADRLPKLSANFGATKTATGNSLSTAVIVSSTASGYMDFGLTLGWELDLWGKLRDRARASYYDYEAAKAAVKAARLSLAVNVARRYFDLIEADKEAELMALNLDSFRRSLLITEEGFNDGVSSAKDLRLMRVSVATAESNYKKSSERRALALATLEALLGRSPAFKFKAEEDFPEIITSVSAGLPSGLVRRRPDIKEAEMRLAATDAALADASKGFLPDLTLGSSVNSRSNTFRELFKPEYMFSKLLGGVAQPVFEGGRIRAEKDLATARRREALALYAAVVLKAFKEVETALSAEAYLLEQERADASAAQEQEMAELIAKKDYESGLVDRTTLLEAERLTYQARLSLLKTRNRRLQNRLGLYLALGGETAGAEEVAGLDHKKRITR
ncbi:hypothetical protein MNBD_DELTA02-188 [hydrothermal vent metagenome]|uniref:Uncharacterized protein n=1 Tax=hydrothermal vent metagenome TaxID=652676 RepID=A0A3B0W3W9_9ZZZZ